MLKKAPTVTYTLTPQVLEMRGDSVEISITGQYPAKFFNKKAVMELTPVLKWEGGEQAFKVQTVQGEAVESNAQIIAFETGGSFSYKDKVAYTDAMDKSDLVLRTKGYVKKEKALDFPETKLGTGVISTSKLAQKDAQTIGAVDQFKPRVTETKIADILFLINQANIRPNELKDADIKEVEDFIKNSLGIKNKEFTGIDISAYASPDGPEALNEKLSSKRGSSADAYLKKLLKKVQEAQKEGFVSTSTTAEDWDGFKTLMEASSVQDKETILRVLQMTSDPIQREKEIKSIAAVYKEIAKNILPQLRRSKLTAKIDLIGKSDSLLLALGQTPSATDSMNIEEYLKAATLSEDLNVKATILKNATNDHPQEWRAFNNLGCVLVAQGKLSEAQTALAKAEQLQGPAMVKNNLGVVSYMNGDTKKALEYYDMASGAGKEVSYNQGIIKIKEGDYAGAVNMMGTTPTFNLALAKMLNGDNDGALKVLTSIEKSNDPMVYYLKAVIGARTTNTDLLFTNLRTAIAKDSNLLAKAKKDMEFNKYFEDMTFKSIIQ